jgi:hypothetical protein
MDAEAPPECVSEDGREVWLHSLYLDGTSEPDGPVRMG